VILLLTRNESSSGISIGPLSSEVICRYPCYKVSNSPNIQIASQGVFHIFRPLNDYKIMTEELNNLTTMDTFKSKYRLRVKKNKLLISTLGTIEMKINEIIFSAFYSIRYKLNWLALNLIRNQYLIVNGTEIGLINEALKVNGLQLALINKTTELKGLQIRLWNANEK
jgi:hypothetical protein